MKHAARALGLLLWVLGATAGAAGPAGSPPAFVPAQLGTHTGSLVDRLRMPDQTPDGDFEVVVLCQVHVFDVGDFGSAWCMPAADPERYEPFRREALRALRGATFVPASVDGERVGVVMPCMIVFRCRGPDCSIDAYPNLGGSAPVSGLNYSAPQVISRGAGSGGFLSGHERPRVRPASRLRRLEPGSDAGSERFRVAPVRSGCCRRRSCADALVRPAALSRWPVTIERGPCPRARRSKRDELTILSY